MGFANPARFHDPAFKMLPIFYATAAHERTPERIEVETEARFCSQSASQIGPSSARSFHRCGNDLGARENALQLLVDVVRHERFQRQCLAVVDVARREIKPFVVRQLGGHDVFVHEASKLDEGVVADLDRAAVEGIGGPAHFEQRLLTFLCVHVEMRWFRWDVCVACGAVEVSVASAPDGWFSEIVCGDGSGVSPRRNRRTRHFEEHTQHMRGGPLTECGPDALALRYNRDDMNSDSPHPANRCHFCAATSYHHLIARDQAGTLRPTKTLVCDGCGRQFDDTEAWRSGAGAASASPEVGKP